jgi:citrate synthase
MARFYTAEEAVRRLGISRNTLYAYVSRGLIRSEQDSRERRTRRYHAQDVERLASRSEVHKAPQAALKKATDWGAPLLDSAITLIGDENFFYRGKPALTLAEEGTFEDTIALLWELPGFRPGQSSGYVRELIEESLLQIPVSQPPIEIFLSVLSLLNAHDVKAFGFTPSTTAQAGAAMLDGLLRIITASWPDGRVAECLAGNWGVDGGSLRLIDAALTLVADHELNMSSFVARCTASAGCSPYSSVAAATHAFFGRRHGGNTERIYGLLNEADGRDGLYAVIASRIRRGEAVPGFGHRLYDVDPRAEYLLPRLPDRRGYIKEALTAAEELLGGAFPTVDFGLLMLERELSLPDRAGVLLFYLGRMAGWVAHIMEQYGQDQPIRPRARYIGTNPAT